ncbi:MAG: tyrosine-type recombinase/integrase [Oscillospiraceae bacterium]
MEQNILAKCPNILKEYFFYMETIKGRSPKTVMAYYTDLNLFFRYIKCLKQNLNLQEIDNIQIDNLTTDFCCDISLSDVYEFLNYTMTVRGNSSAARARKISSIKSFYKYLTTKTTYLRDNPVKDLESPSIGKRLPKYLSLEESLELLNSTTTNFPKRNFCIITLFINCGMRISELVGINMGDYSIKKNEKNSPQEDSYVRIIGKGNKERKVYLNKACEDAIFDYTNFERKVPHNQTDKTPLFISSRNTRLTVRRVEQIVDQCLNIAGLKGKGYSPHKLRHTAATLMYQYGNVDIRVLKEILGHVSVATTEIYTHLSNKQLVTALSSSPLSEFQKRDNKNSTDEDENKEE